MSACEEEASYTLRWRFADQPPAPFSARDCGARGIESFVGTETEANGDLHSFRAVCGMGELRRSLPPGVWTVSLLGISVTGPAPSSTDAAPMEGQSGPFVLQADGVEPIVEVVVARGRK